MKIERLSVEHGERLRAIRLRALADAPDAFASTLQETRARPMSSWTTQLEQLPTFVAVIDGSDVGMVRGTAHTDYPGAAILLSMWVAPEARGRGAGESLIDSLVVWARSEGFERMVLDVADDNQPAIALYARKGFEPTGVRGALPPPRENVTEHERSLVL